VDEEVGEFDAIVGDQTSRDRDKPRLLRLLARRLLHRLPARSGCDTAQAPTMTATGSLSPSTIKIVTTLEELDAKLAECAAAARVSDDELRRVFSTFRMNLAQPLPSDPFSAEYRDSVLALYQYIAGRPYDVRNEATPFDVTEADRRPFPYYTASPKTAGFFLMGTAFLLQCLDLAKGARVVEFGPGWGNSTIWMAMLGFDVTAAILSRISANCSSAARDAMTST
jgi:hypothetical protein